MGSDARQESDRVSRDLDAAAETLLGVIVVLALLAMMIYGDAC